MSLDPDALKQSQFLVFTKLEGAITAGLIHLGDKLGLYRALADGGPQTTTELAAATGLDHSDEMVRLAGERAPGAAVVLGDAEALPFPDAAFTAVAMSVVFFFLARPVDALRECRRVLAPGGRRRVRLRAGDGEHAHRVPHQLPRPPALRAQVLRPAGAAVAHRRPHLRLLRSKSCPRTDSCSTARRSRST